MYVQHGRTVGFVSAMLNFGNQNLNLVSGILDSGPGESRLAFSRSQHGSGCGSALQRCSTSGGASSCRPAPTYLDIIYTIYSAKHLLLSITF